MDNASGVDALHGVEENVEEDLADLVGIDDHAGVGANAC